jgi:hypothetical protein
VELLKNPSLFRIRYDNYQLFGGDEEKKKLYAGLASNEGKREPEIQEDIALLTEEFIQAAQEYSDIVKESIASQRKALNNKRNMKKTEL